MSMVSAREPARRRATSAIWSLLADHAHGCEVKGIDLREPVPPAAASAIYRLGSIRRPGVPRAESHAGGLDRVTSLFGEFAPPTRTARPHAAQRFTKILPNIMLISNIRENGETIGAARRRDDVPPRHHPPRRPAQGHPALFGRNTDLWRRHPVRERDAYDTLDPP